MFTKKDYCCLFVPIKTGVSVIGVIVLIECIGYFITIFARSEKSIIGDTLAFVLKLILVGLFIWMIQSKSHISRKAVFIGFISEMLL